MKWTPFMPYEIDFPSFTSRRQSQGIPWDIYKPCGDGGDLYAAPRVGYGRHIDLVSDTSFACGSAWGDGLGCGTGGSPRGDGGKSDETG